MRHALLLLICLCATPLLAVPVTLTLVTAEDTPLPDIPVTVAKQVLRTDAGGVCRAEEPAGPVNITLPWGTVTITAVVGTPNAFILVQNWRQVVQSGVPAGVALHGSFAWRGSLRLIHSVADANGTVRWPSMPPVTVVIWGDGVTPGVLVPSAVTVTTPLSAPPVDKTVLLSFLFPDITRRVDLSYCSRGGYPLSAHYDPEEVRIAGPEQALKYQLQCGTPFSLLVMTKTDPPRVAALDTVYAPIVDTREVITCALPTIEVARLHLYFETAEHKALPDVNRLVVQPAPSRSLPQILQGITARYFGLYTPTLADDGGLLVLAPATSTLRLYVDCYDTSVPLPPTLQFTVEPGEGVQVVTLPPPLLQVPAKTVVNWVTRNAPANARRLTATGNGKTVSIFGSPEETLAAWYAQDPDHLVVWKGDDQAHPLTLSHRTVQVSPVDAKGKAVRGYFHLKSLLPMPSENWGYSTRPGKGSEEIQTPITLDKPATLWTAPYYVESRPYQTEPLVVPAGDKPLLTLSPVFTRPAPNFPPKVRWHFPPKDYAAARANAAEWFAILYDTPQAENLARHATVSEKELEPNMGKEGNILPELDISFASGAKTITFSWLGVGEICDVPIPQQGTGQVDIVLPDWDAGATLRGQVLNAQGVPLANIPIRLGTSRHPYSGNVTTFSQHTDAEGRFTVRGVPPGQLLVGALGGGWVVTIPPKGTIEVTLRQAPQRFEMRFAAFTDATIWYVPDHGTPRRLFSQDNTTADYDTPPSDGCLWAYVGSGRACLLRYLAAEQGLMPKELPDGPPLGLYFPLDPNLGLPDSVELIGQGACAGLDAHFEHLAWQPVPLLGAVVGQIGAVPPGKYLVKVAARQGVLTAAVTVGEHGGKVWLSVPK